MTVSPARPAADPRVVARARAGEGAAFAELVRTYDRRLRALAFRMLDDGGRMDDVLQEAYLKAFRALPRFEGGSDIGTWLYRIVYNACIDDLRTQRRRHAAPLEDDTLATSVPLQAGPEDRVASRDQLAHALASLPADQRATVLLVDGDGFDHAAAAEILGVAPGTVASRLSRAHASLRKTLGGEP
jgi:RNA polymerase sigma-70 factor (ECF subfamily)